jgi:hypothetical protein
VKPTEVGLVGPVDLPVEREPVSDCSEGFKASLSSQNARGKLM